MNTPRYLRAAIGALVTVLSACAPGDDTTPLSADARSSTAVEAATRDLSTSVLELRVSAGEWVAVHSSDLAPDSLIIASVPEPGAQPYFGLGRGPDSAQFSFVAHPSDRPWITPAVGFYRGPGAESVLLVGSNVAATTFLIGELALELETSAGLLLGGGGSLDGDYSSDIETLQSRPRITVPTQRGQEGFAASVVRFRQNDGTLLSYEGGNVDFQPTAIVEQDGTVVGGEYIMRVQQAASRPGVGGVVSVALLQAGVTQYEIGKVLPPYATQHFGGGAVLSGFVPQYGIGNTAPSTGVDTPSVSTGGTLLDIFWSATEPGTLSYDLRYNFSGRQAANLAGEGTAPEGEVRALALDVFLAHFGFAAIDVEQLYGWTVAENSGL
nr:hypothetical protein [Oceanococcus sp. HetDA_MAG_MS8]